MKVARVYLRVSTTSQDLARQDKVITDAKAAGQIFTEKRHLEPVPIALNCYA